MVQQKSCCKHFHESVMIKVLFHTSLSSSCELPAGNLHKKASLSLCLLHTSMTYFQDWSSMIRRLVALHPSLDFQALRWSATSRAYLVSNGKKSLLCFACNLIDLVTVHLSCHQKNALVVRFLVLTMKLRNLWMIGCLPAIFKQKCVSHKTEYQKVWFWGI